MIVVLKQRKKFMRRCLLDIWGEFYTKRFSKKRNKTYKYFVKVNKLRYERWQYLNQNYVYQTKKIYKFPIPKILKGKEVEKKILKGFYMYISDYKWQVYVKKSKHKVGSFINNFLFILEGRLVMMIYRANFEVNIFNLKKLVKRGNFGVNFKYCIDPNYFLKKGDFLCVMKNNQDYLLKELLLYNFLLKIKNLYVNYFFLFAFYYKNFKFTKGIYPVEIEVMRAIDFLK